VHRPRLEDPGDFTVGRDAVAFIPRRADLRGEPVRVVFSEITRAGRGTRPAHIAGLEIARRARVERLRLEPPMLSGLVSGDREKRRRVALAAITPRMVHAVLAIEDRRFYSHPGVDPIRIVGALFTNLRGDLPYLVGASTITQQLVKNFFLTPE
jgi:penicillin-binding protein 1B